MPSLLAPGRIRFLTLPLVSDSFSHKRIPDRTNRMEGVPMKNSTRLLWITLVAVCLVATAFAADAAWKWTGSYGNKSVEMLIIGDIQVHTRRADPSTAFVHMRETLNKADLVYANLEG